MTGAVSDFINAYSNGEQLALENAELKSEAAELKKKLAEYEQAVEQNEFYKNYLEIKDDHKDFKFTPATLISRDREDPYKGFVINKGSVNGISAHDPVITEDGIGRLHRRGRSYILKGSNHFKRGINRRCT